MLIHRMVQKVKNSQFLNKIGFTKDATNHLGEKEYYSYEGWKRACKQKDPNVKFEGNRDICQAGKIGEWDGATGILYGDSVKDYKAKDGRDQLVEKYHGVDIFYDKTENHYWAAPKGGIGMTANSIPNIHSKIDQFRNEQNKGMDAKTNDPLTKKGNKILAVMRKNYGKKKGEEVFYASKNKGTIEGVDTKDVSPLKDKIIAFFKANPNPDDTAVHAFAEKENIDPHELETNIYSLLSERLTSDSDLNQKVVKNFNKRAGLDSFKAKRSHFRFKMKGDKLPVGLKRAKDAAIGKHNTKPDSDFDAEELAKGIKVEMEHTDDPEVAKDIARDHLSEIPDYYTRLLAMEASAKQ